ncbi:uncharacterized protein METZ01_LOCUS29022 [marine metagenome]|uniref:Uncharacterized protein n=1 Tax=marine metagenome TaxID=408172 RepID=A0A381QB16_9ZZZZ
MGLDEAQTDSNYRSVKVQFTNTVEYDTGPYTGYGG